jgi:hypothetical protein
MQVILLIFVLACCLRLNMLVVLIFFSIDVGRELICGDDSQRSERNGHSTLFHVHSDVMLQRESVESDIICCQIGMECFTITRSKVDLLLCDHIHILE